MRITIETDDKSVTVNPLQGTGSDGGVTTVNAGESLAKGFAGGDAATVAIPIINAGPAPSPGGVGGDAVGTFSSVNAGAAPKLAS